MLAACAQIATMSLLEEGKLNCSGLVWQLWKSLQWQSYERWNDSKFCDIFNAYPKMGEIQQVSANSFFLAVTDFIQKLYRDKNLTRLSLHPSVPSDKKWNHFVMIPLMPYEQFVVEQVFWASKNYSTTQSEFFRNKGVRRNSCWWQEEVGKCQFVFRVQICCV